MPLTILVLLTAIVLALIHRDRWRVLPRGRGRSLLLAHGWLRLRIVRPGPGLWVVFNRRSATFVAVLDDTGKRCGI